MQHQIRFTAQKIARRIKLLEPLIYRQRVALLPFRHCKLESPYDTPQVDPHYDDSAWPAIMPGDEWGEWQTDFVLRTTFHLPEGWKAGLEGREQQPIALYLTLGEAGDFCHPEALVYIDGLPYAACDRYHQEILLSDIPSGSGSISLALHGWTGLGGDAVHPRPGGLRMQQCYLVQIDVALKDLLTIGRVALGTAGKLAEDHPVHDALLNALDEAFNALEIREPLTEGFYNSAISAVEILRSRIQHAGAPMPVELVATGHAHIDVAWLWTLGQTRRKAGRTFYNVIRLMERYPSFHFSQSQPQLYEFVRQDYPELFASIQRCVATGQWELLGGMWVEADCNLSGSESLARQFLLGRSYFREHFSPDAESLVLWLPDVFGYSWNLPQLIQQAGLRYFMTIKIGWSQYNRLPYDTFWWQGLDGTRVLTHFSTSPDQGQYASTYNAMATPAEAIGAWENFQQKELRHPLLMAFGFGDGGGGPTAEMIESLAVMADFPGLPQIHQGSVGSFFKELEDSLTVNNTTGVKLPVWDGELYLELHRGTYTTQARNKLANRRSEFLLHDAEFLATYASLLDPSYTYPYEIFRHCWELVCLNQFHDILPGSSIGQVYVESQVQYADVQQMAEEARESALKSIANAIGGSGFVVNPTSFSRHGLAMTVDLIHGLDEIQPLDGGYLMNLGELPPYSVTRLLAHRPSPDGIGGIKPYETLICAPSLLENQFLRVEFDAAGDIIRIFDKVHRREILPPGAIANQLQAFEDRPLNWEAWDVDIFYDDKMWLAEPADSIQVVESGPLRATVEIHRHLLNSQLIQRISLACNSPRLDFTSTVHWNERHIFLKVAFPVDVLATSATYEIQWGNVQRPTHRNTSWDWARFETCAQKWVDLSEGDYGVSLLNDCKYGHDIQGNIIRLSLLRGATNPDPTADLGIHHFAYSILPHAGGWDETTIAEAYALNDPLIVWQPPARSHTLRESMLKSPTSLTVPLSLVSMASPNLVIETIKRTEDRQGVIVRLYESQRKRGLGRLRFAFPLRSAWRANLLEEKGDALRIEATEVIFSYHPYEIITLYLVI